VTDQVVKASGLIYRQTSPPPRLRVGVPLVPVLLDLAIDLAISRWLLVRILLDKGGLKLIVCIRSGVSQGLRCF